MIFISTTIIMTILFYVTLVGGVRYVQRAPKENLESVNSAINAIMYTFFIFIFILVYMIFVILFENMNALISAILLVSLIWFSSQLASALIDVEQLSSKEKELAVFVSSIESGIIFLTLAIIESDAIYLKYFYVSIAIIVGFFVSLSSLLEKGGWRGLFANILILFKGKETRKGIIWITTITLSIIVLLAFIIPRTISEEVQTAVSAGMGAGCLVFLGSFIILAVNKKTRKYFEDKLFGENR